MPSGVLCNKDGPELPPLDFNINCTIYGRYVIFYNERLVGTMYPVEYVTANIISELCEVTVTGIIYYFKLNAENFHIRIQYIYIKNSLDKIYLSLKIVPISVFMEVIVIYPVQTIVRNVDVTSSMELVLDVHLDGWGSIVQQVIFISDFGVI